MAIKYLYKCNPLVAKAAGVTAFDRYEWGDGSMLLWENDLISIDRDRFFLDNEEFLKDLGAVRMSDPEAAEEQRNPQIALPEARLPEYRWTQPTQREERGDEDADASSDREDPDGYDNADEPDSGADMSQEIEEGGEP